MSSPSPTSPAPHVPDPVQLSPARAALLLFRGVRLRCPNCGGGPLFNQWVKMRPTCPGCQLILDRGEHDYFLGGYTVNFVFAEILIVFGGAVSVVLTWPDVPWRLITWVLISLMVVVPVVFYPFAKSLWLAVDLIIRPLTYGDLAGHGDNRDAGPPEGERP